jgi:hypothetical protein
MKLNFAGWGTRWPSWSANAPKTVTDAFPDFILQGHLRDFEVHLMRKDGSILTVLVSATAIRDLQRNYVMSNCACPER